MKEKEGKHPLHLTTCSPLLLVLFFFCCFFFQGGSLGNWILSVEDTVQKFQNPAWPLCWEKIMGLDGPGFWTSLSLLNCITLRQRDLNCDLRIECFESCGCVNFLASLFLTHFHRTPFKLKGSDLSCLLPKAKAF